MSIASSDIKFYLTSVEPDMFQTNFSQSLGGHPSLSGIYPESTLSSTVGLYDMEINVNSPILESWEIWEGIEYISIGGEIIRVNPISSNVITVIQRGINSISWMHIAGDVVRGIFRKDIFNNSFNLDNKQYRCFAVKNTSETDTAYNVSFYNLTDSLNSLTTIKTLIEVPKFNGGNGISTSWNKSRLVDTSFIGFYPDDYFKDHFLRVLDGPNAGDNKLISSFDSETGTFIFYDFWRVDYDSSLYSNSLLYFIDPSPCQRIKSGTISPIISDNTENSFMITTDSYRSNIDINGRGGNLLPGQIFYIWVERDINKKSELYEDNSIVLNVNFSTEE